MDYSHLTEIVGERLFKECLQRSGLNFPNVILDEWVLMKGRKILAQIKKDSSGCTKFYFSASLLVQRHA